MLSDAVFNALVVLPIGLMSVAFLFVSIRGLVTRRPIAVAARLFVWLFVVAVASMSVALISP